MKVQFKADDDVLAFLKEEIALDLTSITLHDDNWLIIACKNDHGAVIGAMAFEAKTAFDWHLSVAIVDKRCLLIRKLQELIWQTIFTRAVRVTILIDPDDAVLEHTVRKLGAKYEGFLRRGLDGDRDALLFGMLREDCRWLKARQRPPLAQEPAIAEGMLH